MALEIEGSNPSTHPNTLLPLPHRTGPIIAATHRLALTSRTARRLRVAWVLGAVIAVTLLIACTPSDSPAESPTAEWATGTPEAVTIPGLPPGLPVPAAAPETVEVRPAGGVVATWLLPDVDAGASAADLAARARETPGVTVLAAELATTGGIIAFEAERAGHYVVAVDPEGGGTLIELWLDPEPVPPPTSAPGVALPDGYPEDVLPIFPGATVTEAAREDLAAGRERFRVALVSNREPIEVLGYYADHLAADGWTVVPSGPALDATRGTDSVHAAYDEDGAALRLTLEWTPPP